MSAKRLACGLGALAVVNPLSQVLTMFNSIEAVFPHYHNDSDFQVSCFAYQTEGVKQFGIFDVSRKAIQIVVSDVAQLSPPEIYRQEYAA